jgi:hypothetical protein
VLREDSKLIARVLFLGKDIDDSERQTTHDRFSFSSALLF